MKVGESQREKREGGETERNREGGGGHCQCCLQAKFEMVPAIIPLR